MREPPGGRGPEGGHDPVLSDGRFTLGFGAGENLNEHVIGHGWPPVDIRHEMLSEAIQIIRPLLAGIFRDQIRDYTDRLTRALDHPAVLLPTHWDNFERPYEDGPHDLSEVVGEQGSLDTFVKELKHASPRSRVVVLDFFETFDY